MTRRLSSPGKNRIAPIIVLLALSLVLLAISCAVNPVSGNRQLMLLNEQDEIELGKQTDVQIVQQYGVYENAQLKGYINSLGQDMGRISHRPHLNFQYNVLDTSVVNAFAVPGGYVYFTRGILAHLNNEAELAGVMGHEIGHVTARHSAQQYSKAQLAQLGLGLGSMLSETFRGVSQMAQVGVSLLFLKFSRDNEREADDLGVEYSSKVGYDATKMGDFFETLERLHPGSDKSGLPSWFSTHPNPEDRVGTVRRRAVEWQEKLGLSKPKVGHDAYLGKIDGLAYGDDPREGYVENSVFYHPEMKFQFPLPANWTFKNTPSQVQVAPPEGAAAILFSAGKGASPSAVANTFAEKVRATVLDSKSLSIGGHRAHQLLSEIRSQQGLLRVLSSFVQKDNTLFVFHGISSPARFDAYHNDFRTTMNGFRNLTDPARINVQPYRIRVRSVGRENNVKDALLSLGVQEEQLESAAVLNGLHLTDTISQGALVKIVERGG